MNAAAAHDARVTGLESAYVQLVLQACEQGTEEAPPCQHRRHVDRDLPPESCWEAFDAINLEDVFQKRFSVLQSCPHHLKGRLRYAFRLALQERHAAVVVGDRQREIRAWNAFTLIPNMLLQRSQG